MKINLSSVYADDQEKALRSDENCRRRVHYAAGGRAGSRIVKLNDTCGNLIQITQLKRW